MDEAPQERTRDRRKQPSYSSDIYLAPTVWELLKAHGPLTIDELEERLQQRFYAGRVKGLNKVLTQTLRGQVKRLPHNQWEAVGNTYTPPPPKEKRTR